MFTIVQQRRLYFAISGLVIGLGIVAMIVSLISIGTPFRLGVDFRSGTRLEVEFTEPVNEHAIRDVYAEFDITNPSITSLGGTADEAVIWQVRSEFLTPDEAAAIEAGLADEVAPLVASGTQVQSVSPSVGAEVTRAALVAIVVAALVILVYIMGAFRQMPNALRYGVCALSAMVHDLLVIFGFIALAGMLLGWEVDSLFLTAVLTVAGFSLQDTIVVFDRIRENQVKRPREHYDTLVNRSILETMHRSLATQLSAMFVMVAILLFGGPSIKPFIATLFIGMLSGTYSSIFHAVPLLVTWEKWADDKVRVVQ